MQILDSQFESGHDRRLGHSNNIFSLVATIIEQHKEIREKMLPEIDMHFAALLIEVPSNFKDELLHAHEEFARISNLLIDHIYMEDQFVLPLFTNPSSNSAKGVTDFIENHDKFEVLIQQMLNDIRMRLKPLETHMPFRIMLLKMERLQNLLENHGDLESHLFDS